MTITILRRGSLIALKSAMVGWLALIMFPSPWCNYTVGLDGSYGWGLNAVHMLVLQHGRDIVFNYGPLGHWLWPFPWGAIPAASLLFHVTLLGSWIAVLLYLALVRLTLLRLTLAIVFFAIVRPEAEMQVLALVLLCCGLVVKNERASWLFAGLASLFAGLTLFAKFSSGVAACGIVAVMVVILTASDRRRLPGVVLACGGGVLLGVVPVFISNFPGLGCFWDWICGSLAISSGYASALSRVGSVKVLCLALLCLASFLVLLVISRRAGQDSLVCGLCAVPLFVFFKHGFVRQDTHVMFFFSAFLVVVASLLLLAERRRFLVGLVLLTLLGAASYGVVAAADAPWYLPTRARLLGRGGVVAIRKAVDWKQTARNLEAMRDHKLAADRLPQDYVASVKAQHYGVDVVPWEVSIIPANGFNWRPAPVFQFCSAYTASLDNMNALHYQGSRAADIILVHYDSIDGRNVMWDTPRTWRSIMHHYRYEQSLVSNGLTVLRRAPVAREFSRRELGRGILRVNEWQPVPFTASLLSSELRLPWTLAGRLEKLFFRIAPVFIDTRDQEGGVQSWRVAPDVLEGGIMINTVPGTRDEFENLIRGKAVRRVVSIRIRKDGHLPFAGEIPVVWVEDDNPMVFPGEPRL